MKLPAVRGLEAFPVEAEEQMLICVRDPEGFVEGQLLLTPGAYVIAVLLDGERTLGDVQTDFARQFDGHIVDTSEIRKVVDALDAAGFLHSDRFEKIKQDTLRQFALTHLRQAYLAGKSYPSDSAELREFLDSQFMREGATGKLPASQASSATRLRCLIAPHIDLQRGGHSYAHAYARLYRHRRPQIVFIFGVAHAAPPAPFILTRKNFVTPFGVLQTNQEIVSRLEIACSWDPYEFELLHRTEHSIEFQALMLSYLYGPDIQIVPVLCGMFPADDAGHPGAEVETFLNECRTAFNGAPEAAVICGADFAHVGRRFGDPFEIKDSVIQEVEKRDHEDIRHALNGDAEAFYRSVMKDSNHRRVCSLNNIYAALKLIQGVPGELLHYDYAHDPFGGIVSFASIAYEE